MDSLSSFSDFLTQKLQTISHVSLIAHKNLDGDAVGCLEGMRGLLVSNFPHLSVSVIVPPESLDPHVSWIIGERVDSIPPETELLILLDASMLSRTALPIQDFQGYDMYCIDHHEIFESSISGFRDVSASSACLILTELAQYHHWAITPATATALLLGIYTDTGGFLHHNTDARTFHAADILIQHGARQSDISTRAFGDYSLKYLHQLGQGLMSIVVEDGVACLYLGDTVDPYLKNHIVSYLSSIAGVEIACVLVDTGKNVRGSLRTKHDDHDVNILAQKFSGGGHKKASGFELDAHITDEMLHWDHRDLSVADFARYIGTLL